MPPVVGQPLLVSGPFREVRVLEEQLRRLETAISPTVPVSWVLPPVAKILGHLLLAHPSSLSPSFLCIGQCACYSSRRSPPLKKLSSSAPLRPQRHQGSKHVVLVASSIRPIFSGTWALLTDSELPTCLTLLRSSVVSRAAKLLGCRLYGDRSRTSCRPPQKVGWLVLGLRPAGTRRGVTRKRY